MSHSGNTTCVPSADFQIYLFPVVYSLVLMLGLIGNLVALYVFVFRIQSHNASDVYIINLAVVDTLFLSTLPFRIHYHLHYNQWIFGDLACRITGTLHFTNIYLSIAFLTCICLDRYIATVHPHTYLKLRSTRYTQLVSGILWACATATMISLTLSGPMDGALETNHSSCFENFSVDDWSKRMVAYNICALVFGSVIPFTVIMVCYPLVARRISKIRTATSRKALRIIFVILAIAVFCFLPYHITHLLHLLMRMQIIRDCRLSDIIYKLRRVTMAMVSLNSCLDPILYYFATSKFKWKCNFSFSFLKCLQPGRTREVYTIYKSH
ncbi:lysophosphatidic acid receptor 6 [Amia ocellicauda]|uniref:lysophosphatidic acid receptor 6 n=1 Tax=Amia ocellicauda TaxID=2972642 RepID=UPI003464776C